MAGQPTNGATPWRGAVVRVAGEVDVSTVSDMREAFDRVQRDGHDDLLVDLSDTTFMDAAGLAVLLQARRDWAGRILVYQPPASLRRILQVLNMESTFIIVNTMATQTADPPLHTS